jgi:quinolinate synthase
MVKAIDKQELIDRILRLKKQREAIILAHNYQRPEVQDIADFVGDSLGLSQKAAKTDAKVIVFCGVHFMAETAAILCPDKIVLLPDIEAGCSLATMISVNSLRKWKQMHPSAVVVSYVNTTADIKAESDYCCTSTNALKVVNAVPPEREILFLPDMYLGHFIRTRTKRKMYIWPGYCHVHIKIRPERVEQLREEHPSAEFLIHPECGCLTACMQYADKILSTEGIIRHAGSSTGEEFIIGTEVGILHRLKKENPQKRFYPVSEEALCEFMKLIDLEKIYWALEDMQYEIKVDPVVAKRAKNAIDKMLEIV